ncbi:FAD-dependent oxidoreductase, partial [Aeromonas hydrophila]|uniref:FAD-dependent oxidoreductase n=1 Tax=Aeromonas hydrophila TaxID=644 RepID=UPI0036DDC465
CDLQEGGVFAAETKKQLHELKAQQARWEKWGNDKLELLDADGVREVVASDRYVGALLNKSGGHIHPLNPALGEAEAIRLQGGK